ncbi:hypothetical protein [Albidovulum sp.]|uniref:hypothetical protein n=1 Tax=Albidovulum sp. TaxID=1872424 RepID=UPI0039B83C65
MDNNAGNEGIRLFAKAGITGSIIINSGALIATLSQFSQIVEHIHSVAVKSAFGTWALGVAIGTLAWVAAALAATAHAHRKKKLEVVAVIAGYAFVLTAIFAFLFGAITLADGVQIQ